MLQVWFNTKFNKNYNSIYSYIKIALNIRTHSSK